jgi:hypothetical protein
MLDPAREPEAVAFRKLVLARADHKADAAAQDESSFLAVVRIRQFAGASGFPDFHQIELDRAAASWGEYPCFGVLQSVAKQGTFLEVASDAARAEFDRLCTVLRGALGAEANRP